MAPSLDAPATIPPASGAASGNLGSAFKSPANSPKRKAGAFYLQSRFWAIYIAEALKRKQS